MCIVKMVNDPYNNDSSIAHLVNYALRDKRTGHQVRFYGGYNVDVSRAAEQIVLVKEYYHKESKRKMRHFIVSFEDRISPYDAYVLGWQIAAYYADRYQIVFGIHEDTGNPHIHFVFNTVSFADGLKYSDGQRDFFRFRAYVNLVCGNYFKR